MLLTIWHPPSTIECPLSVNNFCRGLGHYTAMKCNVLFPNRVSHSQCLQSVLVYNVTNMHTMSFRSDFLAFSCGVQFSETAVWYTVMLLWAVFRGGLPSFLILTAMLDSQSLNTPLLKVMISSKNEDVFICNLSDSTLQSIFNAWWASMNGRLKRSIVWNNSSHAPFWRFFLYCGTDETGSSGIKCVICHQVLRHPLEFGTSSLWKHCLAETNIAKLNEFTQSEVTALTSSKVDETALAILKRKVSPGITIVSLQS
jgi:hypothetical protein